METKSGAFQLSSRAQQAVIAVCAAAALGVGYAMDQLSIKTLIVAGVAAIGAGILAAPYEIAILALFFYEGFEGMAKIVSNYNPIVHVGSDLIVFALSARWFLGFLIGKERIPALRPPFQALFGLYLVWFLVEFANPLSLGVTASLVGVKTYVMPLVLYLFGFYLAKSAKHVRPFMAVWILTGALQIISGLIQGALGRASVLAISSNYATTMTALGIDGTAFRPFGLTAVPGQPAVFMFLIAPFILYFLVRSRNIVLRSLMIALLPGVAMLLLLCQVRSALLKALVAAGLFVATASARASWAVRKRLLIAAPLVVAILAWSLPHLTQYWVENSAENESGIARSLSLFAYDKVKNARHGTEDQLLQAVTRTPLGAGPSWTGPAGGLFADRIQNNPYFPGGFFSDNFWATTIWELGIPGAALFTVLLIAILFRGFRQQATLLTPEHRLISGAILAALAPLVLGLWGAQGILFNPEASFFWFFAGVLMRLNSLDAAPETLSVAPLA